MQYIGILIHFLSEKMEYFTLPSKKAVTWSCKIERTSDSLNEGLPIIKDQRKVSKKIIFFL